jgi:hypothetical protein
MSTTLSSGPSTGANSRRSSVVHNPPPKRDSGNAETFTIQTLIKPSVTQHSGLLLDHVDPMNPLLLGSGSGSIGVTPDLDDRREGFTWGAPQDHEDATAALHYRRTSPQEPKGAANLSWRQGDDIVRGNSAKADASQPILGMKRSSASSYPEPTIPRKDTSRSSISSIGRGPRRALPDIKMFDPGRDDEKRDTDEAPHKPITKNRTLSFRLVPALRKTAMGAKSPKHTKFSDEPYENSKKPSNSPEKGGLKDRRGLKQTEAMKLTLPLEVPGPLPQGHGLITDSINLADMSRVRQRSPRTPWVGDIAPEWDTANNVVAGDIDAHSDPAENLHSHSLFPSSGPTEAVLVPPRRKSRDRCYINLPRRSQSHSQPRRRSRRSDNSFSQTPDGATSNFGEETVNPAVEPTEELRQLGNKRSRRWRWSGPSTSNDQSSSPAAETFDRQFRFSRFFKKKAASVSNIPPIAISQIAPFITDEPQTKYKWGKSKRAEKKFQEQLANMPVPPTFVPPGLSRVHTPPVFDQSGEIKGKLADFYFEMPGQSNDNEKRQKPRISIPGGVWDSDNLLMPMGGIVTPPSSSNESAPPLSAQRTSNLIERPPELRITTPSYSYRSLSPHSSPLPGSAPPSATQANYFHVHFDDDITPDQEMEDEERAKFEWLIPEHLPTSPLCPLHAKYRGPSKGICVYHGRRKSGARGHSTEGSGESPISERLDFEKRGKRRLASLTDP